MTALRAFISIGIAGLWLMMVVPPMFQSPPGSYTGVSLIRTGALVQRNIVSVAPGSPAYRAGLRTGDALGCLSLRDYALLFNSVLGFAAGYSPHTVITACASRNDAKRTVTFRPAPRPAIANWYGSTARAALRVFILLIFLITGIALVMAKPSPMTWVFYAYCLSSAPSISAQQVLTTLPPATFALVFAPIYWLTGVGVACLLVFTALVPDSGIPAGWRRNVLFGCIVLAVVDVAVVAFSGLYTGAFVAPQVQFRTDETLTALTVLLVLVRLWTMKAPERARFGWAAFAIIFGVVTNDIRNYVNVGWAQSVGLVAAYLTVVMPLSLMYGILRRHVIDVRFVISRTVLYAALTTIVVGVIGLVDWLTSAYLSQVRVAMAIEAAVTIALAFALHRAYALIESGVDFLLFRHKHNAESFLSRLGRTLIRAKQEDTIDRAIVNAPHERLDLTMSALFRADGSSFAVACAAGLRDTAKPVLDVESDLVRFLLTERSKLHLHDLRGHIAEEFDTEGSTPAVAIPLFQGDVLIAFAVYGIHRDGTRLDPDEIETLERLCECAAQAYTAIELTRYRATAGGVPVFETA